MKEIIASPSDRPFFKSISTPRIRLGDFEGEDALSGTRSKSVTIVPSGVTISMGYGLIELSSYVLPLSNGIMHATY